ncbi:unnamed protein product [Cyclocybe aegerita]|uniref:Thioester reductase (TE) domain-containing protein n=1 Tax=Cyclocybe aegerita TaxID=1973307 RepID=A0A8S0VW53_CYCAE|nr:unnamed protein product [Cyclocybe aegerita]
MHRGPDGVIRGRGKVTWCLKLKCVYPCNQRESNSRAQRKPGGKSTIVPPELPQPHFTGATGYIGGSLLARLLWHKNAASSHITVLVRSEDKAQKLQLFGVDTIIGSYTDEDLTFLTDAAAKSDIVFSLVDADNLPPSKAILDGLKLKYEAFGKPPVLIHTSGTGFVMSSDIRGLADEDIPFSDLDVEKLAAIPKTALHQHVDVPIFEADKAGYVRAYIVTPGTVFGYPVGPFVDIGIQNLHSVSLPFLIEAAIRRKQGGYFGQGLNKWPLVDVEDTADLYLLLFEAIQANPNGVPSGYYFAENGEYTSIELAAAISDALVDLGVGSTREPSTFTIEEEGSKVFESVRQYFGTNCHPKADRARALGWKPKAGKTEFLENAKAEAKFYVQQPQ